jgi:LmbE family N-acetylglucosaminyl deacetylase
VRTCIAVSPHLDDAAFSAGGTLATLAREGWAVTVVTCFTGNVARPQGFALACQLDKGLEPEVDYMALRRDEDRAACAALGAVPRHLPFLEAPHRGYASAAALFGARLPDDDAAERLRPVLAEAVARAELVLGPYGVGDHVDHHVVREALLAVRPDALLWEDWPYLDRPHVGRPATEPARRVTLDAAACTARTAACAAYASQLGFQFGNEAAMRERLSGIAEERFHAA